MCRMFSPYGTASLLTLGAAEGRGLVVIAQAICEVGNPGRRADRFLSQRQVTDVVQQPFTGSENNRHNM
ncbi:MAG: hypothetical protein JWO57_820 [Pseudonocardiales bacterium]|nr:hypothetical protein [Pseudonocardiales bacterium]